MGSRLRNLGLCTLSGGLAGLGLGLFPRFGVFSEIRNFQILLLEFSYQGLGRFLPPGLMRALSTAGGELVVFSGLGALLGFAAGVIAHGIFSRTAPSRNSSPAAVSVGSTVGLFTAVFGFSWGRVVLIHSNPRMLSLEGLGILLASLAFGLGVGFAIARLLRALSRWHLEKAALGLVTLTLLFGYSRPSWVSEAAASLLQGASAGSLQQIVLLGADGATWDVALPMIREGKLPHLARLMERGAWGEVRTTLPWKSPILWASIATGKRERAHGIHDFVVRDQENHEVVPVSMASRKVKAVWDIVTEAGLRVDVVNWYAGWPAEPLNGTMVSNRFMLDPDYVADRIFPTERTQEIDALVERLDAAGIGRNEEMTAQVGLYLLERDRPDLHFLYLREIDHMQHFHWKHHAARSGSLLAKWLYEAVDPKELEEKGTKVEEAYERMDAVLGEILKRTGPGTAILVVSDHGGGIKSPRRLYFNLNPFLEAMGLLRFEQDGRRVNWSQTKLYDATERPWLEDRKLFINRRPDGPFAGDVSKRLERELLTSVSMALEGLRTASGQSIVQSVGIHGRDAEPVHLAARVNVRLKEEEKISWQARELSASEIVWRTALTGNHRAHGILVMAGPGIKAGYLLKAASILDITPTLLYLLNLPVGRDMDGRPLLEAIDPDARVSKPLKWIPTYETASGRASLGTQRSTADPELLAELRSLGYIQ